MNELKLTLRGAPFRASLDGQRDNYFDIRRPSNWLTSRLLDKHGNPRLFNTVRFYNGPYFSDNFSQVVMSVDGYPWYCEAIAVAGPFSPTGYTEVISGGCWVIPLGQVLDTIKRKIHQETL
jgi:hypothetical protein